MPELSISNLLLFAVFIVPGAVSLQVYKLLDSMPDQNLKDKLVESIVFSVANFAALYWIIDYAIDEQTRGEHPYRTYFILIGVFFVAPVAWPFILFYVLRIMERLRWIRPQAKTACDHYYRKLRHGTFVIAHLNDGTYIGGRFGDQSYASGYPDSGHIFLEELWIVGQDGNFTGEVLERQGVILRPSDYKYLKVST